MLRALRFVGQFELTVEPGTWQALQAAVPELDTLSAERVREELMKVLEQLPRASRSLEAYQRAGVLPLRSQLELLLPAELQLRVP